MNATTRNVLIIIAIIILVIIANIVWNVRQNASAPASTATSTAAASSTIDFNVSSSTSQGGYTITQVPVGSLPHVTQPDYKAPLAFSSDVPADQQASLQTQFNADVAAITANPDDLNSWIALGDTRKEAGDYQGAATDWQYVSDVDPTNIVSFANLGDLYTNFLPDYPLAAQNFRQEIQNDPQDAYIYDDLYQLYTHQYPQPKAAIVAILQAGLAANPGNATLQADLDAAQAQ